ncbi:MAG: DNA-protecting protein DprA [Clostridiales bacterium]|nr:DNA-protecting protein DprA [Clostridiales bacterium]
MLSVTKFWVWLSIVCPPDIAWQVYRHFGSPEKAYFADTAEYQAVEGLTARQIAQMEDRTTATQRVERILEDCDRLGVHISTWQDADYPERLRNIYTPPMVLYLLGRPLRLEEECAIAVAGSRRCSAYGRSMAEKFSRDLTRQGALVVTGMAPGCDEAALIGAMRAGGSVAALLPGGVDVPFVDNAYYRQLYRDVPSLGTLISTYPPGTANDHAHFRFRNPVLTGLCVVTFCIEAPARSGVMQVAACAHDQQRTVYTIPANLTSTSAAGTNALLCSGLALPVMSAEDLLLPYRERYTRLTTAPSTAPKRKTPPPKSAVTEPEQKTQSAAPKAEKSPASGAETAPSQQKKVDSGEKSDYIDLRKSRATFTDDEQAVLLALQAGEKSAEELTAETGVPSARVLAALTLLTLRGYVEELSGGRFKTELRVK